jgi:DNA-binding response OmpR family regulator
MLNMPALKDREILVFKYDEDHYATLSRLLHDAGARVTAMPDGIKVLPMAGLGGPPGAVACMALADGVKTIPMNRPGAYDVVVAALHKTDMEGVNFVRSIKGSSPRTRIIVVTPNGNENGGSEWIRHGADVHVRKPFTDERLLGVIEAALSCNGSRREHDNTHMELNGRHVVPGGYPVETTAGLGG